MNSEVMAESPSFTFSLSGISELRRRNIWLASVSRNRPSAPMLFAALVAASISAPTSPPYCCAIRFCILDRIL
jgi:hypothetical protein